MRRQCAPSGLRLAIFMLFAANLKTSSSQYVHVSNRTEIQEHLVCKKPQSQLCVTWHLGPVDPDTIIEESPSNATQFCGLSDLKRILPHRKFITVKSLARDGKSRIIFCKGFTELKGDVVNWKEVEKALNVLTRNRRQAPFVPRGRYRGQTQSQYLAIDRGNGKDEGKAEAHSAADSSRASVSGNSGMGQAQSQSIYDPNCDECYGKSDHDVGSLKRGPYVPGGGTRYPSVDGNGPSGIYGPGQGSSNGPRGNGGYSPGSSLGSGPGGNAGYGPNGQQGVDGGNVPGKGGRPGSSVYGPSSGITPGGSQGYGPDQESGPSSGYGPPSGTSPTGNQGNNGAYGPRSGSGSNSGYRTPSASGGNQPVNGGYPGQGGGPSSSYGPSIGGTPGSSQGGSGGYGPGQVTGPGTGYGTLAGTTPGDNQVVNAPGQGSGSGYGPPTGTIPLGGGNGVYGSGGGSGPGLGYGPSLGNSPNSGQGGNGGYGPGGQQGGNGRYGPGGQQGGNGGYGPGGQQGGIGGYGPSQGSQPGISSYGPSSGTSPSGGLGGSGSYGPNQGNRPSTGYAPGQNGINYGSGPPQGVQGLGPGGGNQSPGFLQSRTPGESTYNTGQLPSPGGGFESGISAPTSGSNFRPQQTYIPGQNGNAGYPTLQGPLTNGAFNTIQNGVPGNNLQASPGGSPGYAQTSSVGPSGTISNWPLALGPYPGPPGSSIYCCVVPNNYAQSVGIGGNILPSAGAGYPPYGTAQNRLNNIGSGNGIQTPYGSKPDGGTYGPGDIGSTNIQAIPQGPNNLRAPETYNQANGPTSPYDKSKERRPGTYGTETPGGHAGQNNMQVPGNFGTGLPGGPGNQNNVLGPGNYVPITAGGTTGQNGMQGTGSYGTGTVSVPGSQNGVLRPNIYGTGYADPRVQHGLRQPSVSGFPGSQNGIQVPGGQPGDQNVMQGPGSFGAGQNGMQGIGNFGPGPSGVSGQNGMQGPGNFGTDLTGVSGQNGMQGPRNFDAGPTGVSGQNGMQGPGNFGAGPTGVSGQNGMQGPGNFGAGPAGVSGQNGMPGSGNFGAGPTGASGQNGMPGSGNFGIGPTGNIGQNGMHGPGNFGAGPTSVSGQNGMPGSGNFGMGPISNVGQNGMQGPGNIGLGATGRPGDTSSIQGPGSFGTGVPGGSGQNGLQTTGTYGMGHNGNQGPATYGTSDGPGGQNNLQGPGTYGTSSGPGNQNGLQTPGTYGQTSGPGASGMQGPGSFVTPDGLNSQNVGQGPITYNGQNLPSNQGGGQNIMGSGGPGSYGGQNGNIAPGFEHSDRYPGGVQASPGIHGVGDNGVYGNHLQGSLNSGPSSNQQGLDSQGKPLQGNEYNGIPQNYLDPNSIAIDGDDSEAEAIVNQAANGTTASASSKGGNDKGRAQTNVHGTYTGGGSFQAQAQITGENKEAESEVSGGKKGASSSATGSGRNNKSQASVQLGSETGSVQTQSQSNGAMHSSNSQVQGSVKGGMADAQARGPGSTSSQAQIGFTPYKDGDKVHELIQTPFVGGGIASAQSSGRTGQSQSQLHGTFKYGITYNGAAQAGASLDKDAIFPNRLNFEKIDVFDESQKNINVDSINHQTEEPSTESIQLSEVPLEAKTNTSTEDHIITEKPNDETMKNSESRYLSHTHLDHHKTETITTPSPTVVDNRRSFQSGYENSGPDYEYTTDKDEIPQEGYDTDNVYGVEGNDAGDVEQTGSEEFPNYDEYSKDYQTHQSLQSPRRKGIEVQQSTGGSTQHIVLGSLNNHNVQITQRNSEKPDESKVYQPGERVPGTGGYRIPIGFTGSVKSVASKEKTYVVGSKNSPSQAQTVTLTPGTGKVNYVYPPSYGKYVSPKDLRSLKTDNPNDDRFVSVSKSVTRALDGENNIRKQYSHTYYTKSSSCGYFTFTCTMVSGVDGKKKVCKPKIPTNPDGTPIRC